MLLSPADHLLYTNILPRLGDIEDLPNTQKQIKQDSQNWESKKHAPTEKTGEIPRKRTKRNGEKQSTRYRVQAMVIRMLKGLKGRTDNLSENLKKKGEIIKKDTESIKKN